MKMNILAFGIAKEILGGTTVSIDLPEPATVQTLISIIRENFPRLKEPGSFAVALNNEYAVSDERITASDEIAIIPPVSGG